MSLWFTIQAQEIFFFKSGKKQLTAICMYWFQLTILPSTASCCIFCTSSSLNLSNPSFLKLCCSVEDRTSLYQKEPTKDTWWKKILCTDCKIHHASMMLDTRVILHTHAFPSWKNLFWRHLPQKSYNIICRMSWCRAQSHTRLTKTDPEPQNSLSNKCKTFNANCYL